MMPSLWRMFVLIALVSGVLPAHARRSARPVPVTEFGARPDGVTMNTRAIQAAIDAAARTGATVVFAPGTYLTGSLFVKSGVTLRIDRGVTILGSQNLSDYPERPTRVAGIEMVWPSALINVYEQQHAAVLGEGTIDGDGLVFWNSYWALRRREDPKGLRWAADYDSKRPRLIQVFRSKDVRIGGGLLLKRPGFWTVHLCYSQRVTVDGVTIRANMPVDDVRVKTVAEGRGPSTDGIDIDSSRDIAVAHADIENNDDALCLKAGRDADGLRVNRPTENVVIRDSIIRRAAAGVTFGSETSGGFRNVEVFNLRTLADVPSGILFKSAHTRGGFAENIRIHDMTMEGTGAVLRMTMNWNPKYSYATIPPGLTHVPPYYKTLATPVPEAQGIMHVRDIRVWNIHANGIALAFDVNGYPTAPLSNFRFDHLDIAAQTAGHIEYADHWQFKNVTLRTVDGSAVALDHDADVTGLPAGTKASDPNLKTQTGYDN